MTVFHIMIAIERRVSTKEAPRQLSLEVKGQLHDMGKSADIADTNILYAASWDQVSPWIAVLKGDRSTLKMGYLGWPTVTQAEWEAANPVVKI